MFKKNYWFLRIVSILYLILCLTLSGLMFFIVFGEMSKWGTSAPGEYVNFFKILGNWWYLLPVLSIVNGIISPFFVASIYIHFKYTNNRSFLKFTWLCMFNSIIGDFVLIRPIFLIIFICKIWTKNNLEINGKSNSNYKHLNTRSLVIGIYFLAIIIYFVTCASLNNIQAMGWASMCMLIYGIVPKLVMNSYIDIKFSNKNFSNKWITKYLISSFFGIYPYCLHLSRHVEYQNY